MELLQAAYGDQVSRDANKRQAEVQRVYAEDNEKRDFELLDREALPTIGPRAWTLWTETTKTANTPKLDLSRVEFGFLGSNAPKLRNVSFASELELRNYLIKNELQSFDFGPAFREAPRDKKDCEIECRPLQLDIDITDYTNPQKLGLKCNPDHAPNELCKSCFALLQLVAHRTTQRLKSHFGLKKVAWCFSGKKGVNALVLDEQARYFTEAQRARIISVLDYSSQLETIVGSSSSELYSSVKNQKSASSSSSSSSLLAKLNFIAGDREKTQKMLMVCQNALSKNFALWLEHERCKTLGRVTVTHNRSENAFQELTRQLLRPFKSQIEDEDEVRQAWENVHALALLCPRLDRNVSTQLSHLGKAPFVLHRSLLRFARPLDISSDKLVLLDFDKTSQVMKYWLDWSGLLLELENTNWSVVLHKAKS